MPKLWEKTLDTKDNNNMPEVDLATLAISSPTVVFISGRETTDKNKTEISKSILFIKKLLQDQPEITTMPQVYSWSHSRQLSRIFNMAAYHYFPQHSYRPSAKKLAQGIIMPLVSAGGKPLDYAEAQEKLRNLTLFGYSAGSVFAQEVFNASLKMMQDIGYTPDDARALLQEVALITIGTISRPTHEQDRFTTISLANSDDWFVRAKNRLMHPFHRIFTRAARPLKIRSMSATSLLITAAARGRIRDRKKEPVEIIENVKLPRWNLASSNHEARDYVNSDDKQSQVSRIVLHALINAVNRKQTLTPSQLIEPVASLGGEERALYLRKIAKAQGKALVS